MKNFILLAAFAILLIQLNAQDIIYKKDDTQIKCKITKIGSAEIEYKKWGNLDGPVYTISKIEILLIVYENGSSEIINTPATTNKQEIAPPNVTVSTPQTSNTTKSEETESPGTTHLLENTYGFYGSLGTGGTVGLYTDLNCRISKNIPLFLTVGYGFLSDFDLLMFQYVPINVDYRIKLGAGNSFLDLGAGLMPALSQIWTYDYYSYWESYFNFGFDLTAFFDFNGFRLGATIPAFESGTGAILNLGFAF